MQVPDEDQWRLSMLDKLLSRRQSMQYLGEKEEVYYDVQMSTTIKNNNMYSISVQMYTP